MKLTKSYRHAFAIGAFFLAPISGFAAYVTSTVPPGGGTAPAASFVGRTINVTDFGAKCDVQTGSGTITSGTPPVMFQNNSGNFQSSDNGKPIVITGAGSWTLSGYVNGGYNEIFNVGYNTPCPNCTGGTLFSPSLIGAAGGAQITYTLGGVTSSSIATGYFGTPETGTYALTTTGSANGTAVLTVATNSAPLIGQNGQIVQVGSGSTSSPLSLPVQPGMLVNSSDITNAVVLSSTPTTITLTSNPMVTNPSETFTVSGGSSPYVIVMTLTASGTTSNPASTVTIPGAPLAAYIYSPSGNTATLSQSPNSYVAVNAVPVPTYVAVKAENTSGGTNYINGEFIQINDAGTGLPGSPGTTLQVVSFPNVSVYGQFPLSSPWNSALNNVYTQTSTSDGGSSANFQIQYTKTGQFSYGTDDTVAINQALSAGVSLSAKASSMAGMIITLNTMTNPMPRGIVVGLFVTDVTNFMALSSNTIVTGVNYAASQITVSQTGSVALNDTLTIAGPAQLPQGSDVRLPANSACGVTSTVDLPNGKNSLRGWDTGSQIVALAQMPPDANGYSYVVGVPYNTYPFGGGMRDLNVNANKLAQFTCGIEGGEQQLYSNVACSNAVTAEWLCGYPVAGTVNNQISDTVFDHTIGTTPFVSFGPIALKPAENFLTAFSCSAEQVVNSYFRNGWMNIFDSQPAYNFYGGNIMDSIEPFNAEYCIQLSGKQMVGDTRCLDASAAGIYITGSNATVHDYFENWDNAAPWPSTTGALIGAGTDGVLVDGIGGGSRLPPNAPVVVQQGAPGRSTIVVNSPGATFVAPGPGYGIPNPQGRLTLQSGSPVMTGNFAGQAAIYYDCYAGQGVPYFNGGSDQLDTIPSACEITATLASSTENANDIFDVWWWHNGGSPVLCVATNGTGAGWKGDGGSLSQRGSGYTQLGTTARGYLTNKNDFTISNGAHCYNVAGSPPAQFDYVAAAPGGLIPAKQLTYLGSFYTSAAGQTTFNPIAGGAGVTQAQIGLCNAYNQVPVSAASRDITLSYSVHTASTWEVADSAHSGVNNILVLDCLQTIAWNAQLSQPVINGSSGNPKLSYALEPLSAFSSYTSGTACVPSGGFTTPGTSATQQAGSLISVGYNVASLPLLGMTCAQAIEYASSIATNYYNTSLQLQLPWQY